VIEVFKITKHKYDYREELILDCQIIEVIMILRNFRSLIELLIFGTACLMLC